MHRVIMEHMLGRSLMRGEHIDHIDRNRLNNCRENLRLVTQKQNNRNVQPRGTNKSGYKGVYWAASCKKWAAQITVDGKCTHLGTFSNILDAAKAYNDAALRFHGQHAYINPIERVP